MKPKKVPIQGVSQENDVEMQEDVNVMVMRLVRAAGIIGEGWEGWVRE